MVVSVSSPASDVGRDILEQGGNAVDAAVATAFALAVTFPEAGNLGGGGFMMVMPAAKPQSGPAKFNKPECIEYRETAPAAAKEDMFAVGETALSHKAVGVPGTVRGLFLAHERHGKLSWMKVVAPAMHLASDGFEFDAANAMSLNAVLAKTDKSERFAEFRRVYGKNGGADTWKTGDRLKLPDLAKTLARIAEAGDAGFYLGEVAEQIVAEMKRGEGIITLDDLKKYEAKVREPIHGTFRGYDIYAPPPPSSGGICLVEMLNMVERFNLKREGRYAPTTVHTLAEIMRRGYCDRAKYVGDPAFVDVPGHLTTKEYAAKLAATIDPAKATPSASLAPQIVLPAEGDHTTHFSVIDADGMAVSNTYTLEESYGSRIVVRGAGFLLNNEMGDFNWHAGRTDRTGKIGTKPNLIAPGKRMLSSQTPVIVARDNNPVLVTGSPGGRTIINTVFCVVLNVCEFEMDVAAAVDAPRMHQQWLPERIQLERGDDAQYAKLVEALRAKGHRVEPVKQQGDAHTIEIRDGVYRGYADKRRSGNAAGY